MSAGATRTDSASSILTLVGSTVILQVCTSRDPPASEWTEYIGQFRAHCKRGAVAHDRVRILVVTDGGAPSLAQRTELREVLNELYAGKPIKSSVVTTVLTNPIKRGVATALQWFNPAMHFYTPAQWSAALGDLGLTSDAERIWKELQQLEQGVGPLSTMAMIAAGNPSSKMA